MYSQVLSNLYTIFNLSVSSHVQTHTISSCCVSQGNHCRLLQQYCYRLHTQITVSVSKYSSVNTTGWPN